MVASRVVFTAIPATIVHGNHARRCQHCKTSFTPKRATAKYCSDACRVKAFKSRHKPRQRVKPIPVIVSTCCAHCGSRFAASAGRGQLYCTPSCKTLAYRARRSALIDAVAAYTNVDVDVAFESVEKYGMKRAGEIVRQLGMVYDQSSRRWLIPAEAPLRTEISNAANDASGTRRMGGN